MVCYYFRDDEGEPGDHTFCYSTRFNEVLEELYQEEIGSDVYCDIECNYIRCRARKVNGQIVGTVVENVVAQRPNGGLPKMLVEQMTGH